MILCAVVWRLPRHCVPRNDRAFGLKLEIPVQPRYLVIPTALFVIPTALFVIPTALFVIPTALFGIPTQAGIQGKGGNGLAWIPAYAGMALS